MARNYVRIESVEDIDTSKIGIGNIDNRYIDAKGRRFATRFNKRKRQVEIVRIALGFDEANEIKRKNIDENEDLVHLNSLSGTVRTKHPSPWKIPDWVKKLGIDPNDKVDAKHYIKSLEREIEKFGERFRGIISNLKNSNALDRQETERDFILDISTHYDHDIQEHFSQGQNMITEYQRFPKSISNYIANLDRSQKVYVEKLNTVAQMEYIQAITIGEAIIQGLHGGFNLLEMIENECAEINVDSLNGERRKFFENAMVTIDYVRENIKEELEKILSWMKSSNVI